MQKFMKRLEHLLIKDRFQRIPTDMDAVSMFGNVKDNNLYLLNIIDLQNDLAISLEQYQLYKHVTEKQFEPQGFDHLFLLNIFLTNEDDPQLISKLSETLPNYDTYLVDFHWVVNLENRKFIIPEHQPKQFLNVAAIIKAVLNNQEYEEAPTLTVKTNITPVTYVLVFINIAIWLLMERAGGSENRETLIEFGALFTPYITQGKEYYRLFTSAFLHIGFTHLFYNMFSLYIFGTRVEKVLGSFKFSVIYMFSGLGGSLFSLLVTILRGGYVIAAGASGAIYGLLGSALSLTIATRKSLDGVSEGFLWVVIISGLIFGFTSNNIDNMAHVGGLLIGYFLTSLLQLFTKVTSQNVE